MLAFSPNRIEDTVKNCCRSLGGEVEDVAAGKEPVAWLSFLTPERKADEGIYVGAKVLQAVALGQDPVPDLFPPNFNIEDDFWIP
jgi:hypothetical protein